MPYRPYYLMVTFWGAKFCDHFYEYCLRTLSSPNNIPRLAEAPGSKFIICTTESDWSRLQGRPLFESMKHYLEPVFVDIGPPDSSPSPHLHMSKGHRLAARIAVRDGALAGFMAPDLLVSDGMIPFILAKAQAGTRAVLAPALRYALEPVLDALAIRGMGDLDSALTLGTRELARIAQSSLHSELRRYRYDAPYFGDYPIWTYWQDEREGAFVLHTVSWALLMGDFGNLNSYRDNFLSTDTIDGFYVYHNFYRGKDDDGIYYSTDSDELMFMGLTAEADLTYLPFRNRRINSSKWGHRSRVADINRFVYSNVVDEYRREAYRRPYIVHSQDLSMRIRDLARMSARIVGEALVPATDAERSVQWWSTFNLGPIASCITPFGFPATETDRRRFIFQAVIPGIPWIVWSLLWRPHQVHRVLQLAERLLAYLAFEATTYPFSRRASRRLNAAIMLAIPRRYRRMYLYWLPMESLLRKSERLALKIAFAALIPILLGRLNRNQLASVLRLTPKRYRAPVLRRVSGSRVYIEELCARRAKRGTVRANSLGQSTKGALHLGAK